MFCRKCGNKLEPNNKFCGECGTLVLSANNTPYYNQVNNQINTNVNPMKKSKTPLILGCCLGLAVVFVLLIFIIGLGVGNNEKTIMIYMSGADLESRGGLGSFEKNSIDSSKVDTSKINVLILAGGSPIWHDNSLAIGEVGLFKLEKKGLVKIKSYNEKSLGSSATLTEFLKYGYDNYKADSYDFIFWDHGMGALGNTSDDNTNDNLYTNEIREAFINSPFVGNNKLDTVIFRTCLNSTIEVANAIKDSTKYMIASEEISSGSNIMSALAFINNVKSSDDGYEVGKKFIEHYIETLKVIPNRNGFYDTYAIMDLSKYDELINALEDFSSSINLNNTYVDISRIRGNMSQYAYANAGDGEYDTVDLYDLISKIKHLNPTKADKVLKALNSMVKYNWSNNNYSHGISIYFPYRGPQQMVNYHIALYDNLKIAPNYRNLISNYYRQKSTTASYGFNFSKNTQKVEESRASLKLTDEQKDKYARGQFIIFEKLKDGYFKPILSSDGVSMSDDGTLNADIDNKFLQVKIKDEWQYFNNSKITNDKEDDYITSSMLFDLDGTDSGLPKGYAAEVHIGIKNEEPIVTQTVIKNKTTDGNYTFEYANYLDFDTINIWSNKYKILDKNGKYTEKWENENGNIYLYETKTSDLKFRLTSLDDKGDYYVLFKIYDINNRYYYSNLLKIK